MPGPSINACIEQAIDILSKYFPEDAALLREGLPCQTPPYPKNSWLARPMGRLLRVVPYCVGEMRTPHPASTPEWQEMYAGHLLAGVIACETSQRRAWGRD
jgi:hypothetical protein